jgi:hypothetical protein
MTKTKIVEANDVTEIPGDKEGEVFSITEKALKSMDVGIDGLPPSVILLMEILKQIKKGTEKDFNNIFNELVGRFGSPEEAIQRIRNGDVYIERIELDKNGDWVVN